MLAQSINAIQASIEYGDIQRAIKRVHGPMTCAPIAQVQAELPPLFTRRAQPIPHANGHDATEEDRNLTQKEIHHILQKAPPPVPYTHLTLPTELHP